MQTFLDEDVLATEPRTLDDFLGLDERIKCKTSMPDLSDKAHWDEPHKHNWRSAFLFLFKLKRD